MFHGWISCFGELDDEEVSGSVVDGWLELKKRKAHFDEFTVFWSPSSDLISSNRHVDAVQAVSIEQV